VKLDGVFSFLGRGDARQGLNRCAERGEFGMGVVKILFRRAVSNEFLAHLHGNPGAR
jgi:hypothetical protein